MIALCFSFQAPLFAQQNTDSESEVYLDFRHRGVISSVVISYYKDDQFFLPVSEIFSLFHIDNHISGLVIEGRFGTAQVPYEINFQTNKITFGGEEFTINQQDYILKELDFYMRPELFSNIFGLDFSISFNNLALSLQTETELPAVASAIRAQRRKIADQNVGFKERYDIKYGRERPFLDGGFLDYNLSASRSSNQNIYNFNTNLGLQLYGGDLQGFIFGSYSENYSNVATNNLRWRYMFRDKPWLSKIIVGQTLTDGITRNSYRGLRLTNEPIEARRLFDEFEIQGTTIPQSEVELYLNNALIGYQQADEMGFYRFLTPISYGSTQLNLKIFGPSGQIIEQANRVQIPFNFQPEGVFNYTVNVGQLDNPVIGRTEREMTAQGTGSYGITNWLTAKAGVEYYQGFHEHMPTFTSTLSSRILSNYILTLEAATDAYYRGILNVIYPNSASFNIDYTDFTSNQGIYNPTNDDKRLTSSVFYPFNLLGLPFNIRASTFSRIRNTSTSTTLRFDANSRIGKLNLRLGYSDRFVGKVNVFDPGNTAYYEASATYNISRNRNLPEYLQGVFFRSQLRYTPSRNRIENAEFLFTRNVFRQGRVQISFGRNFTGNFNTIRFSLVVDFSKIRTSTTFNHTRNSNNFTQNVRGSIGYDTNFDNFLFTSRDQVGRSGAAIKLFVDNNGNNIFDEGDVSMEENAVRIHRSGASSIQKNGVLYFTQMQPYYFYNLEMNKGAIRNPMLVPEIEKFGIVTDPNRFKKIEIPFYMSGVIEGVVERLTDDERLNGVAGLKLILQQTDGNYREQIRTFSDGSFYAYEIPPGHYEVKADSAQLELLDVISEPAVLSFEVAAVPEGDFVEGLNFLLKPTTIQPKADVEKFVFGECRYGIQLAAFSTIDAAKVFEKSSLANLEPSIVYNSGDNFYAVRHGNYSSLSEAIKVTIALNNERYPEAVVYKQCEGSPSSKKVTKVQFAVQIAAFNDLERADTYQEEVNSKFDLEAYQVQDFKANLYRVHMGPFATHEQASEYIEEVSSTTSISDFIIKREELSAPEINVRYEISIQLQEFSTLHKAVSFAHKFETETAFPIKIIEDESERFHVVSETIYNSLEQALRAKNQLRANAAPSAVLYLSEGGL